MLDGYYAKADSDHSGLEDEFLCEYVDGTMDPSVRAAFEEYLLANPELAEHVKCLRHTRMLLCHYGCRRQAPEGLQARLRMELSCEMMRMQMPRYDVFTDRLRSFAAFTSAMAVMLIVGMMAGAQVSTEPGSPIIGEEGSVREIQSYRAQFQGFGGAAAALPAAHDHYLQRSLSSFRPASIRSIWTIPDDGTASLIPDSLQRRTALQRTGAAP
jgi:anti-sigma factor RsiW